MRKGINFTFLCLQAILYILTVQAIPRVKLRDREELDVAQIDVPSAEQQIEENNVSEEDDDSSGADTLETEEEKIYNDDAELNHLQRSQKVGLGLGPLLHHQDSSENRLGSVNDEPIIDSDIDKYEGEQEVSEENPKEQNKKNLYDNVKTAIRRRKLVMKDRDKRLSGYDNKPKSSFEPSENCEDTSPNESDAEDYDEKESDSYGSQSTPGKDVNTKNYLENHHNFKGKSSKKLVFYSKNQNRENSRLDYVTELNKAFSALVCAVEKFMALANKTLIAKTSPEGARFSDTTRDHPHAFYAHKDTTTTSREMTSTSKETTSNSEETTYISTDSTSEDFVSTDSPLTDFTSKDTTSTSEETSSTFADTTETYTDTNTAAKETITTPDDAEETQAMSNTQVVNTRSRIVQGDLAFKDEICTTKMKLEKGESTVPCDPETETPEYRRRKLSKDKPNTRAKKITHRHSKNNYRTPDNAVYDSGGYVYHEYDSVDPNADITMVPRKVSTLPTVHLKSRKSHRPTESINTGIEKEENPIIQQYSSKKTIHKKKVNGNKTKDLTENLICKEISSFRKPYPTDGKQNEWGRKRRAKISSTIEKSKWRKKFSNQGPDLQHLKVFNHDRIVKTKSQYPHSDIETIELEYV